MSKTEATTNSAKFTFLYLLSLISLIFVVISVGNIIFQLINKHIADTISIYRGVYSSDAIKFAISSLIIAAPVYYLSVREINKNLFLGKLDIASGVRRWLTYLILFIASVVSIGWLIVTIYSFLDGELTLKFSLKTLSVLIISATTAIYYFYDIQREKAKDIKDKFIKNYFWGTILLVIVVFMLGLFFVESPQETRQRKTDNLILEKFMKISFALDNFYVDNGKLPENLEELKGDVTYLRDEDIRHNKTNKVIEYKVLDENKYALCAEFYLDNIRADDKRYSYLREEWPHKAGHQCLFKKVTKTKILTRPRQEFLPPPEELELILEE